MSLLDERKRETGIIEGLFIRKILMEQAQSIIDDSRVLMKGFTNPKWNRRSMSVDETTLTYTHIAAFRFVDMRSIRAKTGYSPLTKKMKKGRIKKKFTPIHNKPIFSNKRFIVRRLSFGFTDEVKNSFLLIAKESGLLNRD